MQPVANTKAPHIVFALTDDLGSNYPGFRNAEVRTPTLDHLALTEGVVLDAHYMTSTALPRAAAY